jgi:hypothetical protein
MPDNKTIGQNLVRVDFAATDKISKLKQAYANNIDHVLSAVDQENQETFQDAVRLATKTVDALELAAMFHVKLVTL